MPELLRDSGVTVKILNFFFRNFGVTIDAFFIYNYWVC